MRKLASFDDPAAAQALDQLLSAAEIPTVVRERETTSGGSSIWIVSEQDVPKAQQLLAAFLSHPLAAQRAPSLSAHTQDDRAARAKPSFWTRVMQSPVTWLLLVACVVVAIYTDLGDDRVRSAQFTISSPPGLAPDTADATSAWSPWDALRRGELWRLFTPILLHFHPFHLLFNAFWLRDLGVPCERFQGSRQYVVFLLWSSLVSNVAQLVFGHSPNFGGLSGVVYALMGFLWARGHFDRSSGIHLPTAWVVFFVGWLVLGFTGLLDGLLGGSIANYCHLGGFAAGVLYGYIAAMLALHTRRR